MLSFNKLSPTDKVLKYDEATRNVQFFVHKLSLSTLKILVVLFSLILSKTVHKLNKLINSKYQLDLNIGSILTC